MFGSYLRLNLPVTASTREVIRACRDIMSVKGKSPEFRHARKQFYTRMLQYHEQSRELVKEFRL